MDTSDFAKRLADKLIEQLKAGTAPWQQPWEAGKMLSPYNPTTGNRYRGILAVT
jgi:putative DNA primase/helicase